MQMEIRHESEHVIRVNGDDHSSIIVHRTKYDDPHGEDREVWGYSITRPLGERGSVTERNADIYTGVGKRATPREMLGTLLSFLGAAAESYDYQVRTDEPGENLDLFTPPVVEWAYQNSDELSMLAYEIEGDDDE